MNHPSRVVLTGFFLVGVGCGTSPGGADGSTTGTGGGAPGTGGSAPGTGGSAPGTGGGAPGTGGSAPGTGGSAPGTGGSAPGTGGAMGTGGATGTGGTTGTGGSGRRVRAGGPGHRLERTPTRGGRAGSRPPRIRRSSRSRSGCRARGTRRRWGSSGINIYVGNNAGTDSLAAADLATLKAQGIYAIVGQDSVGLANIDDPTIVGWWMHRPTSPTTRSRQRSGTCCDPPVAPVGDGHQVQRVQGGRSDAPGLPGARARRRLRRLGGARQQRAGGSRATCRRATSSTSTSTPTTTATATRTSR